MPHTMVCECKGGMLEVSPDSMTTTGDMWTCHKGMVETVENKGTAPAIMRVIELRPPEFGTLPAWRRTTQSSGPSANG